VRKLPIFAVAGLAAAILAGSAVAASPQMHNMDVPLPDGSVAHIEYAGNVAPKVTVAPPQLAGSDGWAAMPFPSFAGFDKMIQDMQRQSQEMMRRARDMSRQPMGAAPYIASYGSLPAGETSTTIVSVSNGATTCTRTTEVVSQGPGKAPKVTSNVSGQCADQARPSNGPTHPA